MTLKKGIYKHFKGNLYKVFGTAKHSETEDVYVIYQALYGNNDYWVRPLTMFTETIKTQDSAIKRFTFIRGSHDSQNDIQ